MGCRLLLTEWKITPGAPSYCLVDSSPRLLRGSSEYAYLTRKLYYWSQHYIIGIDTVNRTPPGWRIYQIVKTSPFSNCEKKIGNTGILVHTKCFLCVCGTLEFPEVLSNTGWHFPKRGSGDAPLLEVPWALSTLSFQFENHLQRKLWPSEVRWKKWRWDFLLWNERQIYFNYRESTAMKLFQSWWCATNYVIFSVRAPRVCNYVRSLWNCVGTCLFHMYLIREKFR